VVVRVTFDGVIAMPYVELHTHGMGKLQPWLWIGDQDRVQLIDPRDFPNDGMVLMPREFHLLLREYPLGRRLVRIGIIENLYSSMDDSEPGYTKYMIRGAWQPILRWTLQHVVNAEFDPQQPVRRIRLPFEPEYPIWLRDPLGRTFVGPFDTNAHRDDDGSSYLVDLIAPADVPWPVVGGWPRHGVARVTDLETVDIGPMTLAINSRDRLLALGRRIDWVDFIDDDQLVDFLRGAIGGDGTLPVGTFASLAGSVARLPIDGPFDATRVARAAALIDRIASWETRWDELVQRHLASEAGRNALRELLLADPTLVDARWIPERHPKVLERLGMLAASIAERQAEVEALTAEIDELRRFDRGALERKRSDLERELADVTNRVEEARHALGVIGDLATLLSEHARLSETTERLRSEAERLEREVEGLRAAHEQLRGESERSLVDLRGRLTQLKPYVDALTGGGVSAVVRGGEPLPEIRIDPSPPESLPALLDVLHGRLLARGHRIGREDCANALAALLTSPLTVLAGLPGVGKTSLVTRMANALGMAPHAQFLTVRVPRGWRGRHDVIGYLNPITGAFEEAPTGVYPFLRRHAERPGVPAWILFDEANLSPPEHYLSEWLGLMDEDGDRTLLTGRAGERLSVPDGVRIVFTTNQDHTVEPLSPRLLDRAAVVVVRSASRVGEARGAVGEANGSLDDAATARLLAAVPDELPDVDLKHLETVIDLLGDDDPQYGQGTHVSIRKRALVERHALVLREMLGRGSGGVALDLAVGAHLIPLLRGSGEGYRARLEKLEANLGQMRGAHALLKRVLTIGRQRFDEYDFQTLT
jgi:hypothetical protein